MAEPVLRVPFGRLERQREADRLGMLIFLATEVMLFGGIFAAALSLRVRHSAAYVLASREMHYGLGGINTAVLLTSSLLVALAIAMARDRRPRASAWSLAGAVVLAIAFLAIKLTEYSLEWRDGLVPLFSAAGLHGGATELFMMLYFIGTGLHALHVTAGIVLLAAMIWPFGAARRDPAVTTLGNVALYWHFVDVVWIFLYPTLYLAR